MFFTLFRAFAFYLPYPKPNMEKEAKFDCDINFATAGSTVTNHLLRES